ncbi:MAG: hypothetical protein ISR85_01820 [Kiritimatiellales bacterium]|nr:hypothetical protein [Kiritimatiellota bacterium]MBL7011651.1 hypothetical protein [Kiritimatiellales bacterium]
MVNSKKSTWLFNPFTYIAGWQALLIGLILILVTGYIGSLSNTHFDGVLDTHTGRSAPLWFFLITGIINWLCMGVVLWLFGKKASKGTFRSIDLFGTQALARWPLIFTALACTILAYTRFIHTLIELTRTQKMPETFSLIDASVFGLVVFVMLAVLCWTVRLMYMSYKVSCDPAEGKAKKTFIIGLIVAEILSKVVLIALMANV